MKKLFTSKYGPLVFSLLSGIAYFILAMFIFTENMGSKGLLLGFFFFPAIICGVALVLLKSIKMWLETENSKKIYMIAAVHIIVMLLAVAMVILKLISRI